VRDVRSLEDDEEGEAKSVDEPAAREEGLAV